MINIAKSIQWTLWAVAAGASALYGVDSSAKSNAANPATTPSANSSAQTPANPLAPNNLAPHALSPNPTTTTSIPTLHPAPNNQSHTDMGNLAHNSRISYRYNTRFDKDHAIQILGAGGEMSFPTMRGASSFYGGGVVKYDGIIDRYPLGVFLGYAYQGALGQGLLGSGVFAQNSMPSSLSKLTSAQSLALGVYSDVFFEAHHVAGFIAQSFQAAHSPSANTPESSSWLFTSATNLALSYGYVFAFGSSFLEPYSRFNLHVLYPMHNLTNEQKSLMSAYVLRSSLELGVQYRQFMGRRVFFSIAPAFRQDIGVIGIDSLARLIALDMHGQAIFALPDSRYHSYATLALGLTYRASKACTLSLNAQGIYTRDFYSYGAQAGVMVLF